MKKTYILIAILALFYHFSHACSMFKFTIDHKTYVGNNEDYYNPNTWLWTSVATKNKLGVVYFGYEDFFAQGAINEAGLVFDGFSMPLKPLKNKKGKKKDSQKLLQLIMATCTNIEEVKTILSQYKLSFLEKSQLMFVDKAGNSIIVESDTMITSTKNYQIATNFHQSLITANNPISCERYLKADNLLKTNQSSSIAYCKSILDTIHQAGFAGGTQYSNIYDLENGIIYLYLFHNFQEEITLSVKELLNKGNQKIQLASLFKNKEKYENYKSNYYLSLSLVQKLSNFNKDQSLQPILFQLKEIPQTLLWISKLFESINNQLNKKHYAYALTLAGFCDNLMPNTWQVALLTSKIYYKAKDYEKALLFIDKAIALNPNEEKLLSSKKKIMDR